MNVSWWRDGLVHVANRWDRQSNWQTMCGIQLGRVARWSHKHHTPTCFKCVIYMPP